MTLGAPLQLKATGRFDDDTTYDVTGLVSWTSSDNTIVTVDTTTAGRINAVSPGHSSISATLGSLSATTQLLVTDATLQSMHVLPENATLAVASSQALSVTGQYSDGSERDITAAVSWQSGDNTIADVVTAADGTPYISANAAGSTSINASLSGIAGRTFVTVHDATLDSVSISPGDVSVAKGVPVTLHALGSFSNGEVQDISGNVEWRVADTAIATISNTGAVTSLLPGTTTVSVKLPGVDTVAASTTLTVTDAILQSIDVTPASAAIAEYTQQAFTATGHFSDATTQDVTELVTWTSSNTAALLVSNASGEHGVASGIAGPASATLTADYRKGSVAVAASATVSVLHDPARPVALTIVSQPDLIFDKDGDTATLSVTVKAADPDQQVADGTLVDFTIVEGSGTLSAASAATVDGKAQVTLTSDTIGSVKVKASVQGTDVENYTLVSVTDNFAISLAGDASVSAKVQGGMVKKDSSFSLTVTNFTSRTYDIVRYEFFIGTTSMKAFEQTDFSSFHSGTLPTDSPLNVTINLTEDTPEKHFKAQFSLVDPLTGQQFLYFANYTVE